jgi:hypothetical protein
MQPFIIFLYYGYTLKTKYRNPEIFTIFWLTSGDWKTPKALDFRILKFEIRFLAKFRLEQNG